MVGQMVFPARIALLFSAFVGHSPASEPAKSTRVGFFVWIMVPVVTVLVYCWEAARNRAPAGPGEQVPVPRGDKRTYEPGEIYDEE